MKEEYVDWSESALQRWLGGITKATTKATYKSAYRFYAQYTGQTATQLIDEALEDTKKDPREKTDIVKQRLIGFYNWLEKEAPKRKAVGRGVTEQVGKGVSSKSSHLYVNAIRSFYGTFDVYVKLKGRSKLPKPRVKNKRMLVNNLEVKKLVDNARSLRDRAIILTMFQSGMDVSTLCSLTYGDVAEGLKANDHPLKLSLYRQKSGTEFYTFLGKDAIESLKSYLKDVETRGLTININSPLFLKEGYKARSLEGIKPNLIEKIMRELAVKSGFVDDNNNGKDFNPLSPHALRESFGSIMTGKGVPDTIVDFWLGHEIGEMAEAYKAAKFEDVKQIYAERERFISFTTNGDLEQKLRAEIDEKNKQLQSLVNDLTAENLSMRERTAKLEAENKIRNKEIEEMKHAYEIIKPLVAIVESLGEEGLKVLPEAIHQIQRQADEEARKEAQKEDAETLEHLRKGEAGQKKTT